MAVKNFEPIRAASDITTTRTLLHEAIPLTGQIVSGTYGVFRSEGNVKNYSHGMFQSVYDYPYLSSSANHIIDITTGYDESSYHSASSATQNAKKINIYNQFSQVLLGYSGSNNKVEVFESDLKLDNINQMKECIFLSFSRLLIKDQIKKGTVNLKIGTGSSWLKPFGATGLKATIELKDSKATATEGTLNTVGGDYGVLYATALADGTTIAPITGGVVFYQAGIIALTSSIFSGAATVGALFPEFYKDAGGTAQKIKGAMSASAISGTADAIRHRIYNISLNNTTEINSTIYFCRMPHNKYNYSANPTYTDGSKIRVKNVATDYPKSYVTSIGLYNAAEELLAVAKLSEPLKKDPTIELTLRTRLDY
jgi:hypothetical protein|tara:strand:+ start:3192 stop:4295 length:1104 start_codon:yes stop_codon:yes gene_type:complete